MKNSRVLRALLVLVAAIPLTSSLPAAEPAAKASEKTVEFPTTYSKAEQTAKLVFAISTAKEIKLLSLDPVRQYDKDKKDASTIPTFHGFAILRTARLTDSKDILRLAESLGKSIDAGKENARCFSPRHALSIATSDGPLDVVVCFECKGVDVHGFSGLGYTALAPEPAQTIWESIFTAHLITSSTAP